MIVLRAFGMRLDQMVRLDRVMRRLGVPVIVMSGHGVCVIIVSHGMRRLVVAVSLMTMRVVDVVGGGLRFGRSMIVGVRQLVVRGLDVVRMGVRGGLLLHLVEDGLGLVRIVPESRILDPGVELVELS